MAATSLGLTQVWPPLLLPNGRLLINQFNMFGTGANSKLAYVFAAPKAGTLDTLEFRVSSIFNNQTTRLSFQDVGTDGKPDGTADQFRTFTPAVGWNTVGLVTSDGTNGGTKRSVTQGQWVAAVFEFPGTVGDYFFSYLSDATAPSQPAGATQSDGYYLLGSTFTSPYSHGLIMALKYDDGSYGKFLGQHLPISAITTESLSSSSTPNEIGIKFDLPIAITVAGVWIKLSSTVAFELRVYDTAGTLAGTIVVAVNYRGQTNGPAYFRFATPLTLASGSGYRVTFKPTTTTSASIYSITTPTSAHRAVMHTGSGVQYTTRKDAGAWTETATKLLEIGLIYTDIDTGGGGGSSEIAAAYLG